MAGPEVVPPLSEGVPDLQHVGADAAPVVPAKRLPLELPPRVVGENPLVVEVDEVVPRRAGVPLGGLPCTRPMIHGGKRASCSCFENPPGRSWYGWGPSCGGHSRVPFTTRREATKSLSGLGGGGGVVALCRGEPLVRPGRRA